jgi:hypothetical protein
MKGQRTEQSEAIDAKTSRAICDAVGEKLQQSMRPDFAHLPERLRHLIDALRRKDAEPGRR